MGKTPRERLLLTLLPAIVAVCGYMLIYDRTKDLTAANEALAAAKSAQVSPDAVFVERMKLDDLREESDRLKAEKTTLEARKKELASIRQTTPAARTEALRQLSHMLWDRGLHLYQESAPEATDSQTSPSFEAVIRSLTPPAPPPNLFNPESSTPVVPEAKHLWQVRFYGRYSDVAAALESLRDSGLPIVPVSITMSETRQETNWRSWTLLLWL